jgi:hypothetical protein
MFFILGNRCLAIPDQCIHSAAVKPKEPDRELTQIIAFSTDRQPSGSPQCVRDLQFQRRPISFHVASPENGEIMVPLTEIKVPLTMSIS